MFSEWFNRVFSFKDDEPKSSPTKSSAGDVDREAGVEGADSAADTRVPADAAAGKVAAEALDSSDNAPHSAEAAHQTDDAAVAALAIDVAAVHLEDSAQKADGAATAANTDSVSAEATPKFDEAEELGADSKAEAADSAAAAVVAPTAAVVSATAAAAATAPEEQQPTAPLNSSKSGLLSSSSSGAAAPAPARRGFLGGFFSRSDSTKEKKEDTAAAAAAAALAPPPAQPAATDAAAASEIAGKSGSGDSDEGSSSSEEVNLFTAPSHAEADSHKPCIDDFSMLRVLGKGSYGKVVLVRKKSSQVLYAMKVLKKGDVVRKRQVERTKIERRVLGAVDHPFLMKLHYAFQTGNKLYLVLDYCPGGELFFHLSRYKRFPEGVVRFYSAQLVLALKHLHDGGVIYRDIKPENILLDVEGHIKLGDFGLAKDGITDAICGAQSVCGTPEYMAPEVINKAGHGTAVDWWGLGMLMYEMLTGLPPWYTKDRQKLFERLRGAPLVIPKGVSAPSASIIQGLLTRNPAKRLGALGGQQVMSHEFFRGLDWDALYNKRIPAPLNPCRNHGPNSESTHNFDTQFTRLPIDTIAQPGWQTMSPGGDMNFDGFTYDHPSAVGDAHA